MGRELISVIIPVYNTAKYLEKCLESVINQTYKNLEIILIDDGSTDHSSEMIDSYSKKDNRIVAIHQKNKGVSFCRQMGIELSKGKYISFIDSDDSVDLDIIEGLHKMLVSNNADISFYSFCEVEDGKIYPHTNEVKTIIFEPEDLIKQFLIDREIGNYQWGHLFERELFNNIKYKTGKKFEDISTSYKIVDNATKIVYSSECKYYYTLREDGICGQFVKNKDILTYVEEQIERYNYIKEKHPNIKDVAIYNVIIQIANAHRLLAYQEVYNMYESKEFKDFYEYMKKLHNLYEKDILQYMTPYQKVYLYLLLYDREMFKSEITNIKRKSI